MWFLFGFLTISICICIEFWRRHLSRWSPEGTTAGLQYKHYRYKNKLTWVYLGVTCHPKANFTLKRQSRLDSFFKRIGVANEFETGDASFDDLIYLVSDSKTLHYALANSSEFRSAAKKLMNYGIASQLEGREIHCRNGRLWATFKTGSNYNEGNISQVAKTLVAAFDALSNSVQEVAEVSGSRWKDPFVIKAAVLLAISSGIAINGVIQVFRVQFGRLPFTVDYSLIVYDALIYSLIAAFIFALISLYWLGRSARAHIVLIELVTIGAFGIFLSFATEMRDINIEMDSVVPEVFEASVTRKYTSKGRRSGTKYYVVVKNWNCDCGNYSIRVPEFIYRGVSAQSRVQLLQHKGYLGYPWISDVKAL
ncbi:MAG: hypothetical protein AAGC78_17750 [Cellvibrio sp.]|uniref:hypothetical protein n=1 Tax=Cellvibrio sp. TaxID=1965322 RepID=UPI0031A205A5